MGPHFLAGATDSVISIEFYVSGTHEIEFIRKKRGVSFWSS